MSLHLPRRTTIGLFPSEGARQAWAELARRGWDQSQLRQAILAETGKPIASGTLTKYLYCDRRPGVPVAGMFHRVLGVEPARWYEPPAEPIVLPAARASQRSRDEAATDPSDPPSAPHDSDPEANAEVSEPEESGHVVEYTDEELADREARGTPTGAP